MASKIQLDTRGGLPVIVRAAAPEINQLWEVLFRRYPNAEWATFARFGWRETINGLVLTLSALDPAVTGDLDEDAGHVVIHEPYTLRVAIEAERHSLAVGIIHSHPAGGRTWASRVDDDMDQYYARYFEDFAPNRPYISLIFAREGDVLSGTGRVYWKGRWHAVEHFSFERSHVAIGNYTYPSHLTDRARARVARLASAFGEEAAERLARSTVAVIGAGGTGSPAIEVLARAGVGHIIVVDPDVLTDSNLERVHGSILEDAEAEYPKAALARRHVRIINPDCRITALRGSLPQPEVVDAVLEADVVVGCTDQQHSRLALSDLAIRYLVPAIDCGVLLEGSSGHITSQIIQFVRFLAADPCALCRNMVEPTRLAQELMSEEEKTQRRAAAQEAEARGEPGNAYWRDMPQINTVGYLTTTAGSMAAGYAIGWLTGRFDLPFSRLQMNLIAPYLDTVELEDEPRGFCACRRMRGTADQGRADALISPPSHWPSAKLL
jgi:tRNA A37 threonylcarbamoyladenosine dehydratase